MANGRNAANGKAGVSADQIGIGFAQGFARIGSRGFSVHTIGSGGDEQDRLLAVRPGKDDRFCNLVDIAGHGNCSILGGSRQIGFLDVSCDARRL